MSDSVTCEATSNHASGDAIVVTAPARLHFGLLELCQGSPHQFGGIGLMIDQPSTALRFRVSDPDTSLGHASSQGKLSEDIANRIAKVVTSTGSSLAVNTSHLQVIVDQLSGQHVGLGSGTQVAAAVATGVAASAFPGSTDCEASKLGDPFENGEIIPARSIWERWAALGSAASTAHELLTRCANRGARSHIGLFGFVHGGFVFDSGSMDASSNDANAAPRRALQRNEVPDTWRVMLVTPQSVEPVHGQLEVDFIRQCGHQANGNKLRMLRLISDSILPNLRTEAFDAAGEAIYEYSVLAGELFQPVQGGVFRDQTTTFVVQKLRELGLKAVGQSSWGPTVFGIVTDQEQAEWVADRWRSSADTAGLNIRISTVNNSGANVQLARSACRK